MTIEKIIAEVEKQNKNVKCELFYNRQYQNIIGCIGYTSVCISIDMPILTLSDYISIVLYSHERDLYTTIVYPYDNKVLSL